MKAKAAIAGAVAAVLVLVSAACTNGNTGDDDERGGARASTTTVPERAGFTIALIDANGTTPPSDVLIAHLARQLDNYLDVAIVSPLRSGQPAGDLSALLSAEALARLADPATRATMVDEGLPPASRLVSVGVANANLSSVAAASGAVGVVGARIDVKLHAVGPAIDIDIIRQGDLVFAEGSVPDTWVIDSFSLRTERHTR